MVTIELEKILKEEPNEEQSRYLDSLKKFEDLVKSGVVKKRGNQLLVDNTKLSYNI